MNNDKYLLTVKDLRTYFPVTGGLFSRVTGHVRAVDGVSFSLKKGETLGLVGESGCGKTTAGRSIIRLIEPTSGEIYFKGQDVVTAGSKDLRVLRQDMQIIFQDPYSSLNPRKTVADIIGEALLYHGKVATSGERDEVVKELLVTVGLSPNYINRYPHEFSGGQRQRIGIARAIALNPLFIVCDEAVSALDVSIQAQVLNLLMKLRDKFELTYLFIAHDLSVVKHISTRIAVMYLGQIMEEADSATLFKNPTHPYTKALLSAIPIPDPKKRAKREILKGDVPTPLNPPPGCRFCTRCPKAMERCWQEEPKYYRIGERHYSKCFLNESEDTIEKDLAFEAGQLDSDGKNPFENIDNSNKRIRDRSKRKKKKRKRKK